MRNVTLAKPRGIRQWLRLYRLYLAAFPVSERKPFSIIVNMYRRGKSDVWCIERDGKILGFAATVNSDALVLLDYLAVDQTHRGEGIGTDAMLELLRLYAGKGVFVEIESTSGDTPDREARLRRKQFYRNCDMEPLNVTANVFGVSMELLGRDCTLTFEEYQAFYRDNYSVRAVRYLTKEQ